MPSALSSLIVVLALSANDLAAQAKRATGSIELTDPAGDVDPIQTSDGKQPGLDITKLSITSDGKQISFATTLASAPGVGSGFLELYFDTDPSAKTGVTLLNPEIGGFDLKGALDACAAYNDSSSSCISARGTLDKKAQVTRRYAMLSLSRYKGKSEADGVERIVEWMGFAPTLRAPEVPIVGTVVQASLDYTSLKVKSGQTIRILARESSSGATPTGEQRGFFPEILLTLK